MLKKSWKWNHWATVLMAATLLAGTGVAQVKGKTQTLTGNVSDFLCGAKHTMMKDTPDKDCTLACVKAGSKYSLVVGDKVYELDGKEDALAKFAGGKAKVTGIVDGTKLHVTAVSAG